MTGSERLSWLAIDDVVEHDDIDGATRRDIIDRGAKRARPQGDSDPTDDRVVEGHADERQPALLNSSTLSATVLPLAMKTVACGPGFGALTGASLQAVIRANPATAIHWNVRISCSQRSRLTVRGPFPRTAVTLPAVGASGASGPSDRQDTAQRRTEHSES